MRKTVMMLAAVLVLMLAACTPANEDTTDNNQNESSQNENTESKQADKEQKGSGEKEQSADFNVKVEDKTIKFQEANLPVVFTITKNGKPYTGVALGLQVVNKGGFIPFTAEEIGDGRYEGKIRVTKPGQYKINVFRMDGQEIIVLDSFKLDIS